jgi:hypothetical protein
MLFCPPSAAPFPAFRSNAAPAFSPALGAEHTGINAAIAAMFELHDVRQAGFITLDDHLLVDRAMCELNGMVFDEASSIDRFAQASPTALRDGRIGRDAFTEHFRRQTSLAALSEADVIAMISRINAQLRRARTVVAYTNHGIAGTSSVKAPTAQLAAWALAAMPHQPVLPYTPINPEALRVLPNIRPPGTERWYAQEERRQHDVAKARVLEVHGTLMARSRAWSQSLRARAVSGVLGFCVCRSWARQALENVWRAVQRR